MVSTHTEDASVSIDEAHGHGNAFAQAQVGRCLCAEPGLAHSVTRPLYVDPQSGKAVREAGGGGGGQGSEQREKASISKWEKL